jgi:hypothetical protein
MLTLLDESRLLLDFEGAKWETLALVTEFGVMGVDCEAMARYLRKLRRFKVGQGEKVLEEEEAEAFRFKTTLLSMILLEFQIGSQIR